MVCLRILKQHELHGGELQGTGHNRLVTLQRLVNFGRPVLSTVVRNYTLICHIRQIYNLLGRCPYLSKRVLSTLEYGKLPILRSITRFVFANRGDVLLSRASRSAFGAIIVFRYSSACRACDTRAPALDRAHASLFVRVYVNGFCAQRPLRYRLTRRLQADTLVTTTERYNGLTFLITLRAYEAPNCPRPRYTGFTTLAVRSKA